MAHVIEVPEQGMSATQRCDRCGGQAYVEVLVNDKNGALLFCGHHYTEHEAAIMAMPEATVADHRPFLRSQEQGVRDAASAPK